MPTPAFPGAEGFGSDTIGGTGGQVIHVTNLLESGPGSFREAIETPGPRIVVFDVSGTIDHQADPLAIEEPFVTIDGSTAPGGGIAFSGEEFRIQTHDVIMRYLRIRTGDVDDPRDGWEDRDCLNFGHPTNILQTYNIVIDHCSLSWSVDEIVAVWYDSHDITIQYCFITEALHDSFHPASLTGSTKHSMGLLTGISATNLSIHHNLIANCDQRNPQFAGNNPLFTFDPLGVVDFRNNLVLNWGLAACEIQAAGNRINFVNNLYKLGPNTPKDPLPTCIRVANDAGDAVIYIAGNIDPTLDGTLVDNWPMVRSFTGAQVPATGHQLAAQLACPLVTTIPAADLFDYVLRNAGARLPHLDEVDARIIQQAQRRCWKGGTKWIIDSTAEVGGWPVL